MGFRNFMRKLLINAGSDGRVTGGDYLNYGVSLARMDDGSTKIAFGRSGQEPFYFDKNDVQEFTTLETGARWSDSGNNLKVGNRYKVVFKNGKASIMSIVANSVSEIEGLFIL